MAAAKALTIKQLRKRHFCFHWVCGACFHVQVEEWKDRDEIVQMGKVSLQFVQKKVQ